MTQTATQTQKLNPTQTGRLAGIIDALEAAGVPNRHATVNDGSEAIALVHLSIPFGDWNWYVTEYDQSTGEIFAMHTGPNGVAMGYFTVAAIAALPSRLDAEWQAQTLAEIHVGLIEYGNDADYIINPTWTGEFWATHDLDFGPDRCEENKDDETIEWYR